MSEYAELYIDRGTDFSTIINLNDDETNIAQNLVGYVVTSQMRKSLLSQNAYANLVCSVTNASNGELTIGMSAANTANLRPGNYFFDVKMIDTLSANSVTRLMEGVIFVTHSITG